MIAFVCPTFNFLDSAEYTVSAITTFLETTPQGIVLVVDDASLAQDEDFRRYLGPLAELLRDSQRLLLHRFTKWGGLTRSWNWGLAEARKLGCEFAIAGNNDVLFTPGWFPPLREALDSGFRLVGPCSNAAGVTSEGLANVTRYLPDYRLSDDPSELQKTAEALQASQAGTVLETPINGFFMLSRTQHWWEGRYNEQLVFCPRNPTRSNGKPNATPLMTLNEDELQGRWRRQGWKSGVVPASFIFHYRSVCRGTQYAKAGWYRKVKVGT